MSGNLTALGAVDGNTGFIAKDTFQNLTKNITENAGNEQIYTFTGKQLQDIHMTGKLTTPEEQSFISSVFPDHADYVKAVTSGKDIQIKVPASTIIKIADKPWFAQVKSIFKLAPTNDTLTMEGSPVVTNTTHIAGLLTSGENTPQDVINTIFKAKMENTADGKAIIKAASEAQTKGQ